MDGATISPTGMNDAGTALLRWKSFAALQIKRRTALSCVLAIVAMLDARAAKARALAAWHEVLESAAQVLSQKFSSSVMPRGHLSTSWLHMMCRGCKGTKHMKGRSLMQCCNCIT